MNLSTPVIAHWSYSDLSFLSWNKLGLFLAFCLHPNPKLQLQLQLCNVKFTKVKNQKKIIAAAVLKWNMHFTEICWQCFVLLLCSCTFFCAKRFFWHWHCILHILARNNFSSSHKVFKTNFFLALSSSHPCQLSSDWERLIGVLGFTLHLDCNNVDLFVLSD